MSANIEKLVAKTFLQMAEGLETGSFGARAQNRADRHGQ